MLVSTGNIQCISARELIDGGYITESCYRNWVNRGRIKVVRRGGGAAGNCALVALNSLPTECLERVKEDNPGGTEQALRHWILSNYVLDQAAVAYFLDWASHSSSNRATDELARKYAVNASVLNTCIKLYNRNNDYRKLMGEKYNWDMMATTIETLREDFGHDLPMKGGEYVHAYYAYDVVSQCRIGLAYGRDKDDALVVDCFRDMFRLMNATDGVFQPVLRWSST